MFKKGEARTLLPEGIQQREEIVEIKMCVKSKGGLSASEKLDEAYKGRSLYNNTWKLQLSKVDLLLESHALPLRFA